MNYSSYLYVIIVYHTINGPDHTENVVNTINVTIKPNLKGKMELIGKLTSKVISKIGILPSASK